MGRTFIDGIKCGVPKGINKKGYKIDSSKENDTAHQRGAATSMDKDRQLVFSSVNWTGWSPSCFESNETDEWGVFVMDQRR